MWPKLLLIAGAELWLIQEALLAPDIQNLCRSSCRRIPENPLLDEPPFEHCFLVPHTHKPSTHLIVFNIITTNLTSVNIVVLRLSSP